MWAFHKPSEGETSLKARVAQLEIEREAYRQEVFESNRYAAWVSHERQTLIDRLNFGTYASQYDEAQLRVAELQAYIADLESRFTASEDERLALAAKLAKQVAQFTPSASKPATPLAPAVSVKSGSEDTGKTSTTSKQPALIDTGASKAPGENLKRSRAANSAKPVTKAPALQGKPADRGTAAAALSEANASKGVSTAKNPVRIKSTAASADLSNSASPRVSEGLQANAKTKKPDAETRTGGTVTSSRESASKPDKAGSRVAAGTAGSSAKQRSVG